MNKNKEFLLCEDPLDPDFGHFLLHTAIPALLIQILHMDEDDPDVTKKLSKSYEYNSPDGYQEIYQLVVIELTDGKRIYNAGSEKDTYKILDRAWQWYKKYLKWEDSKL